MAEYREIRPTQFSACETCPMATKEINKARLVAEADTILQPGSSIRVGKVSEIAVICSPHIPSGVSKLTTVTVQDILTPEGYKIANRHSSTADEREAVSCPGAIDQREQRRLLIESLP